jgi:hypothetical protein
MFSKNKDDLGIFQGQFNFCQAEEEGFPGFPENSQMQARGVASPMNDQDFK